MSNTACEVLMSRWLKNRAGEEAVLRLPPPELRLSGALRITGATLYWRNLPGLPVGSAKPLGR